MKRIVLLLLVLLLTLPAFAQVGRFKIIKFWYPGYSLKLDTATGELWAVHFDVQEDQTVEEVISKKQSHNHRQIGRYELRRTRQVGTYQIFDTSSGLYTLVKWTPKNKDGEPIGVEIDSLIHQAGEGLKRFLKELEEDLEKARESLSDSLDTV